MIGIDSFNYTVPPNGLTTTCWSLYATFANSDCPFFLCWHDAFSRSVLPPG